MTDMGADRREAEHPSPEAYRQATRAHEWEVAARRQAARADYLEELLRKVLEIAEPVESTTMDDLDDRLYCEQDGCMARGWRADGFVGLPGLAWCPTHAPPDMTWQRADTAYAPS